MGGSLGGDRARLAPKRYALLLPTWGILFKIVVPESARYIPSQPLRFAGTLLVSAKVEST